MAAVGAKCQLRSVAGRDRVSRLSLGHLFERDGEVRRDTLPERPHFRWLFAATLALTSAACGAPEPPLKRDAGGGGGGGSLAMLREPCCGAVDTKPVECAAPTDAGGFTFVKVATWKDDA